MFEATGFSIIQFPTSADPDGKAPARNRGHGARGTPYVFILPDFLAGLCR